VILGKPSGLNAAVGTGVIPISLDGFPRAGQVIYRRTLLSRAVTPAPDICRLRVLSTIPTSIFSILFTPLLVTRPHLGQEFLAVQFVPGAIAFLIGISVGYAMQAFPLRDLVTVLRVIAG
jgi:hypothetical protein